MSNELPVCHFCFSRIDYFDEAIFMNRGVLVPNSATHHGPLFNPDPDTKIEILKMPNDGFAIAHADDPVTEDKTFFVHASCFKSVMSDVLGEEYEDELEEEEED